MIFGHVKTDNLKNGNFLSCKTFHFQILNSFKSQLHRSLKEGGFIIIIIIYLFIYLFIYVFIYLFIYLFFTLLYLGALDLALGPAHRSN